MVATDPELMCKRATLHILTSTFYSHGQVNSLFLSQLIAMFNLHEKLTLGMEKLHTTAYLQPSLWSFPSEIM